jgi:hypothetical protein
MKAILKWKDLQQKLQRANHSRETEEGNGTNLTSLAEESLVRVSAQQQRKSSQKVTF